MKGSVPQSMRRRDIQGLRAVAILAVVAYHAGLPVPGGYVGVDVFFVISGYLITQLLWDELSSGGRLSFAGFYARRARRLLPSAVLVILVTVVASVAVLGPLEATAVAKDAVACALYVGNYRFALQATNYLSAQGPVSPLQNYWSLGVEEQFYLVWPALLLAAAFIGRARGRHRRSSSDSARWAAVTVLAVLGALSFWMCVSLTHSDQPWAFFSLPTRAWELAVGGLVALAVPRAQRAPVWVLWTIGWTGLGAVAWSLVAFGPQTLFPGPAALVPVAGTGAALVAGTRQLTAGPAHLLGLAPLQPIGAVAYTWYLWHWPMLVLAPSVLGHRLGLADNVAVCLFSLVPAALTTLLLEQPARRSPWLSARAGRSLVIGGGLSLAAALAAVAVVAELPPPVGSGHVAAARLVTTHPTASRSTSATPPAVATADSLDAQVNRQVYESLANPHVPANLTPSLADAAADAPVPEADGCFDGFTETSVNTCLYGDTTSSHTVVLFGDSHALQWFPAIDNLAKQQHDALVVMAKATCPPIDITIFNPDLGHTYTECNEWRASELQRMTALRPTVVILGFSREYGIPDDHVVVDSPAWLSGLSQMINTVKQDTGGRVVLIGDDPYPQQNLPDCLSEHLTFTPDCSIPKHYPFYNPSGITQEKAVAASTGAGYVDTDSWFCIATNCTVIVANVLVYRDDNHITATYANWLTPVIGANLAAATDGAF